MRGVLRSVVTLVILSSNLQASDAAGEVGLPEFAGIARISESVFVCAVLEGESRWLSAVGETIGAFKLVAVDTASRWVAFERSGEVTRVWLRKASIVDTEDESGAGHAPDSLDVFLDAMMAKAVFVGFGELSAQQKEEMLLAQLNHILSYPDYSPEKRRELLTRKLNQERSMNIGPKGISDAEAAALGIPPEKAAEMNAMHRMGPMLRKLSKEEGKPVALEID
jgi:hypothetical protein